MSTLNDIAQGQAASDESKDKVKKTKAQEEIDALALEEKKLSIKAAKLAILEREANLQDIQERLAERELQRENRRQRIITNGQTLKQLTEIDNAAQRRCNHRKGGNGAEGVIGGQGDDSQFAVIKHIFANGDMWVRCLRCGKTWKPPIKEQFKDEASFLKAVVEYETAVNFQTRNVPSAGVRFGFSDNGAYYRQVTANSTLR